jgi:two-component system, chemotaxis family, CheB/CheR fusion protein
LEFQRQSRRLFSVLRAIIRRSADSVTSSSDLAARLESRIGALGRVHEMIMRSPREGIDLEELVHGELLAQAIAPAKCRVTGPDTRIGKEAAMSVALALHELAVNALLHGALVDERGTLAISWSHRTRAGGDWLCLLWQETQASNTGATPKNSGFGLELLERSLPYELDARTRIDWSPSGVHVQVEIPGAPRATHWHRTDRVSAP